MRSLHQMKAAMAMSLLCAAAAPDVPAAPEFVNGLALDGALLDRSGGTDANKGLAVGPRLKDGSYALVTGTDNDYSVTQNATGQQFDVYFRVTDPDPFVGSIQCPLGLTTGCFTTADIADGIINEMFDLPNDGRYKLLPGVLHAYKVSAADLGNFVRPDHHHDGDDDDDQGDDDKE